MRAQKQKRKFDSYKRLPPDTWHAETESGYPLCYPYKPGQTTRNIKYVSCPKCLDILAGKMQAPEAPL